MVKNPEKVYYFRQSQHRKKQIYDWFNEVVEGYSLQSKLAEVKILLSSGNVTDAYFQFKDLALNLPEETLVYLIEKNQDEFGKRIVMVELMQGVLNQPVRLPRETIRTGTKIERTKIEKVEEELENKTRFFGIDSKGKRTEAEIIFKPRTSTKGEQYIQVILRDKETKQFLKRTDEINKLLKERGIKENEK